MRAARLNEAHRRRQGRLTKFKRRGFTTSGFRYRGMSNWNPPSDAKRGGSSRCTFDPADELKAEAYTYSRVTGGTNGARNRDKHR